MSINIQSILSQSKKQALSSILSNVNVNFPYIKKDIELNIKSTDSSFTSLLNLYQFRDDIVSSSQVSAVYLLAYLDFFALYVILLSNYDIFNSLQATALNKYMYIFSLYRGSFSIIKEKSQLKDNAFVQSTNFLSLSNIDMTKSQAMLHEKNLNGVLPSSDVLTLPRLKSKTIYPRSIYVSDNDSSIHSIINKTTQLDVDYTIARQQFQKISIPGIIAPAKRVSYSLLPEVNGTIFGYIGDYLFVKVSSVIQDSNGVATSIRIQGSTDALSWSSIYQITPGDPSPIKIEDDTEVGFMITLYGDKGLVANDVWKIGIRTIHVPEPIITSKIDFSLMEQVSYIRFDDVSRYKLNNISIDKKEIKYNDYIECTNTFSDDLSFIVPVNSKIDSLRVSGKQSEPYAASTNGMFTYNYDYKLYDIRAIINEYAQSGIVCFSNVNVSNIKSAKLELSYYLQNEQNSFEDEMAITEQKMFIENSIFIQNQLTKIEIPILDGNRSNKRIVEHVKPFSVKSDTVVEVRTRFPINILSSVFLHNVTTGDVTNIDLDNAAVSLGNGYYSITITDYSQDNNYAIVYMIDMYSFDDLIDTNLITNTKWINKNGICYMYYRDMNNKNCIAIRKQDSQNAIEFSGDCFLSISMKSIAPQYVSPMVYDYNLIFN